MILNILRFAGISMFVFVGGKCCIWIFWNGVFLTYCFFLIYKSFCKKIQNFQSLQKIIAVWVICIIVMMMREYIQKNKYEPFYEMLVNWQTEIINSFTLIDGRRINNSFIESKNRILEKLLYNGKVPSRKVRT